VSTFNLLPFGLIPMTANHCKIYHASVSQRSWQEIKNERLWEERINYRLFGPSTDMKQN
jgi:hypothetical protein